MPVALPDAYFWDLDMRYPQYLGVNSQQVVRVNVFLADFTHGSSYSFTAYLSADDVFDSSDIEIGSETINRSIITHTTFLTVPDIVAPGEYNLIYVLDVLNELQEADETNNIFVTPGPVIVENAIPELAVVADRPIQDYFIAGWEEARGRVTIDNYGGTGAASNVTVHAYLSNDDILDASDVLMGSTVVDMIDAQQTQRWVYIDLTAPETVPYGDYRVIYVVDQQNTVSERDETNNILVMDGITTVGPSRVDLSFNISNFTTPDFLFVGGGRYARVEVENAAGTADVGVFEVYAYLSADGILDDTDIQIGSYRGSPVNAGGTNNFEMHLTPPTTMALQDYTLIYVVDPENDIGELDEANNIIVAGSVGVEIAMPDLEVESVPFISSTYTRILVQGHDAVRILNMSNANGTNSAYEITVNAYLSSDDVLDASDVFLGTISTNYLDGLAVERYNITLSIPDTIAEGDYRLIYQIDPLNTNAERDETNNITVAEAIEVVLPPLPELHLSNASNGHIMYGGLSSSFGPSGFGAFVLAGELRNVPLGISNYNGLIAVTDITVNAYIIGFPDEAPTLIGSATVENLAAGASLSFDLPIVVPTSFGSGTYRIMYSIDPDNEIRERSEITNTAYGNNGEYDNNIVYDVDLVVENSDNHAPAGYAQISSAPDPMFDFVADTSGLSDADGLGVFSYQWLRDGVAILGATSDRFQLTAEDANSEISYFLRYTDGGGVAERVFSTVIQIADQFSEQIFGDQNDNHLTGVHNHNTIYGFDGNDILSGGQGSDLLVGGNGTDRLIGNGGNDTLIGGDTRNDLRDMIYGGDGNDTIDGGYGNDTLRGDAGDDNIVGGFGADTVIGGTGNDVLTGSAFGDLLFGGDGMDFINGGFGHDRVNGGAGADRFYHLGIPDHGSDWVQDYNAAEGDVLLWGGWSAAGSEEFQVNFGHTSNAAGERSGDDTIEEAFVIFVPTGQIIWALVDAGGQAEINIQVGETIFDLLV